MGFLAGGLAFERYRVLAPEVRQFNQRHVQTLEQFAIGQIETSSLEDASVGFLGGRHLLDVQFGLEKNVLEDCLHFGVRIDTHQIPSALRKAWLEMELVAQGFDPGEGRPTRSQRQQAKEALDARCQAEAQSGKFRRMQQLAVLWDAGQNVLYLGSTSPAASEHCLALLERAFELHVERLTAGRLAQTWASDHRQATALEACTPAAFHAEQVDSPIAWLKGATGNCDFLGNEFLLWLWWTLETQSDAIQLADDSEVIGMLNRTLSLECPRAESGKETITAEAPVRLPEAMRALSSGKLPRKTGLLLVRQGIQHELVLQAETLAVSGARQQLSESGSQAGSGTEQDRIEGLRHLCETLDLLFGAFCRRRLAKSWNADVELIRRWLSKSSGGSKKSAA